MSMSMLEQQKVYEATLSLLTNDSDGSKERLLWEIVQWEENNPPKNEFWGWEWYHVHGDSRTLISLVTKGILNVVYRSASATLFKAADRVALKKALDHYKGELTVEVEDQGIPPDIFSVIVGHEYKKDLIRRALESPKPVHSILYGSPASAKTLMLEELSRLPKSHFVLGSSLTKAGLYEVLFTERPTYLILDELDKIDDPQNLAALLSLMERGVITETKYRRQRRINLRTWVFASANDVSRIPGELMSRFLKMHFMDYKDNEFKEVVVNVLRDREGIKEDLALYIANKVLRVLESRDVRDAVRVSRLIRGKTEQEVDNLIQIMKTQRGPSE